MVIFHIVVVLLALLGVLGIIVEGLLWLSAFAVVLVLVAIAFFSRRLKASSRPA